MNSSKAPVFIIAPTRRSGTNFLASLIKYSNQFYTPELISEALFLLQADHLNKYINKTIDEHSKTGFWDVWKKETKHNTDINFHKEYLFKLIGDSILKYSDSFYDNNLRLIFKIPDAKNINLLFDLFPNSKLIILERDGRDVTDSYSKSLDLKILGNPSVTNFMKLWSNRAKFIHEFVINNKETENQKWIRIKYEDLIVDPVQNMKNIFSFIDVNLNLVSWENIEDSPIIGSSIYRDKEKSNTISFRKIKKPKNAQFTEKWKGWPFYKKTLFKYYCGDALQKLGYTENNNW